MLALVKRLLPLAAVLAVTSAASGCGGSMSGPLVGTDTATISAPGQPTSTTRLVLNGHGQFDLPDIGSTNGKIYFAGTWGVANDVVTMTCSTGLACVHADTIRFGAKLVGKDLGSPTAQGTFWHGDKKAGTWYARLRS